MMSKDDEPMTNLSWIRDNDDQYYEESRNDKYKQRSELNVFGNTYCSNNFYKTFLAPATYNIFFVQNMIDLMQVSTTPIYQMSATAASIVSPAAGCIPQIYTIPMKIQGWIHIEWWMMMKNDVGGNDANGSHFF